MFVPEVGLRPQGFLFGHLEKLTLCDLTGSFVPTFRDENTAIHKVFPHFHHSIPHKISRSNHQK
jgi:hypothetical protein